MSTVRWQGPHGWRFGKLVREDAKHVYVQMGEAKKLTRVPKDKIKSWPGEKKK
jgi:hypothetical protein